MLRQTGLHELNQGNAKPTFKFSDPSAQRSSPVFLGFQRVGEFPAFNPRLQPLS